MNKKLRENIYEIVKKIPQGKVLRYGDVARLAGGTSPRYIGTVLHQNPDPGTIPCHRVVNAKGQVAQKFAFGGDLMQMKLLKDEGVIFLENGNVDLKSCLWDF